MALARVQPPERVVLANVVWMDRYDGDSDTIRNVGHQWDGVHDAANSGEAYTFRPVSGRCYGYMPRFSATGEFKQMAIQKLGAIAADDEMSPVTVISTATHSAGQDRRVVGWYRNATAFRWPKQGLDASRPNVSFYFSADASDCHLVPADQRTCAIEHVRKAGPGKGPGHDSIHYPSAALARRLLNYINGSPGFILRPQGSVATSRGKSRGSPKQPNPETRAAVEAAAMAEVEACLISGGWSVKNVSAVPCGWDMTATKKGARHNLLIEVKGLSGPTANPELTPNEYKHLQIHEKGTETGRYVVAIVTEALVPERRRLLAFSKVKDSWLPFDMKHGKADVKATYELKLTEAVAARCSVSFK